MSARRSSPMTRTLTTLTAAAALALAAGCSSVKDNTPPPSGTVGSSPYSSAPAYTSSEATQYGYVRNITQLEASRRTSGAGAILGAVVGGVVGNQIGGGSGRPAGSAIGAVGAAVAGDRIEQCRSERQGQHDNQADVRLDN